MTDHDLHHLVRDHVSSDEPPFALSPDRAIAHGRRTLRRRRLLAGGVCVAALAAVAGLAVPTFAGEDKPAGDDQAVASSPGYDATQMPRVIDERTRAVLTRTMPDLPKGVRTVTDDQGTPLPREQWDEAAQMTVEYTLPDHEYRVSLLHAAGEAEGDNNCTGELEREWALSCDGISEGTVATVTALRRTTDGGWRVVRPDELTTTDPRLLWFSQTVEMVRSDTFVVSISEVVKARNEEVAAERWRAPFDDLLEIATDPELTIPPPPTQ